MSSHTSYNNDKVVTGEVEYPATDPASGAFFQPDYKKNEDLKIMLDGSKDSLKLEAMKRIIGMIAKGRDASDLFPAVVKNVVSKNIEVKKLVYVYLVRYAEEQQDLALLSISTFQRALKDPNQLIRASALRVLSSIRVYMIVPILMLAISDSANDMSPYVRKTAAHAIPKLYSIDPDEKEELVAIIDKLLSDKAPLVVGSAAMAFLEVCPDQISLIHRSYRKLCSLLADVDEWGQLAILNVLTVYAKSCFPDPNNEQECSSDSDEEKPYNSDGISTEEPVKRGGDAAHDLRLLLRAARPLLHSRSAAVVVAAAQLYVHTAPVQELPPVAKAMVRLLRGPVEVQSVVLNSIAALTVNKRSLFEPYLKSFFVRTSDPTHIKLLKLEILTNLATEASAPAVLREFQTYVSGADRQCGVATIQAIGRLAVAVHSETETCLAGLLRLLSSKDEVVVCEAVVVVKRVVCGAATSARAALARAARLLRADRLAPSARAAAVWLIAEHGANHARAAAVLAHMAKNFAEQDELVKLQVLTLAVKLSITQPDTLPICRYILAVSKYDVNYDVRDRARFLKAIIEPKEGSILHQYRERIFCQQKQNQTNHSNSQDREQYTLGSLSQYIGRAASGYAPLPTPPPHVLHHALRDVDTVTVASAPDAQKDKEFYYSPESSGSGESGSSSSSSSSGSEESSDEEDDESKTKVENDDKTNNYNNSDESSSGSSDSESDSDSSDSSDSSESDSNHDDAQSADKVTTQQSPKPSKPDKSNLELLLELDAEAGALPTLTPTCGGFLSPPTTGTMGITDSDTITPIGPSLTPTTSATLFSRVVCGGLEANYRWTRAPHLFSNKMAAIEITFTNHSNGDVNNIRINKKTLTGSRSVHDFSPIQAIAPTCTATSIMGVDFADTIQPVEFTIISPLGEVSVSITPPVGELMRAVNMSESRFELELKKLRGMTECDKKAVKIDDDQLICRKVYETANLGAITSSGSILRFAGKMMSSQDLVLLSVKMENESTRVTANCPNMAVASLLANEIAQAFAKN